MKEQKPKLYVWTGLSTDYTSGLAFAIAESEDQAKVQLDHLEAVKQARADALRWVLELISPIKIDAENNYDRAVLSMIALVNDERAILRARLRELIAAQRGEVDG